MPRDYRVYLEDIVQAVAKIRKFTKGLSKDDLVEDEKTLDAVIRNLEVIGEAVKKIPDDARTKLPGVEWKKIGGLRDVLIHEYFGINTAIVWDIVQNKLPTLEKQIQDFLK